MQTIEGPTNCRLRLKVLGLPYPKSGCGICGTVLRPGWRCAEGLNEDGAPISPIDLENLRRWAVEQAIAANGAVGVDDVLDDAAKIERWVMRQTPAAE